MAPVRRRRQPGQPFLGWGTGSGLDITTGLIRPDEVRAGEIRHAIVLGVQQPRLLNTFRAPATRTDQPNGTTTRNPATAMEMGMRLQLDSHRGLQHAHGAGSVGHRTRDTLPAHDPRRCSGTG
ncbi:MAG: hypothetical protein U0Y82_00130 [Thermoleophilia bacterium]